MPKKISVNAGTLVDLKAELFRKQEQLNRQKRERDNEKASSSSSAVYVKGGKPILHEARKAAAAQEKLQRRGPESGEKRRKLEQLEASLKEEERQLSRSRQRLEEKAALYEKLKNGRDDGSGDPDGLYLVNFGQKAYEDRQQSDESDEESDHDRPSTSRKNEENDDEEDWVEYTDVLGRTRKCLRQDLPNFIAADEKLKEGGKTKSSSNESPKEKSDLLSEDMRRELKRKAWEQEEEEAASAAHRGPVHFQHLAQGESRELGVGYFNFAPDEQTRQDQLKLLDDLRQQTLTQRERSQKMKEKRQAAMKARLEKVKERKNLTVDDDDMNRFLGNSDDDDDVDPVSNLEDIPLPSSPSTLSKKADKDEIGPRPPPLPAKKEVRPWDVGKPRFSQEKWADDRRKERSKEFAPPSFY